MNPRLLILIYLLVTLLPLGFSWWGARPPRSVADELASGAGMLAFAILLAEFLLSGRFRSVSRRVGIDVTMRFHQLLARTALGLALIHPFLYQAPFHPPYPWDVTRQLTLSVDAVGLATGFAAWLLLGLLVFQAVFRDQLDMRYEIWRATHGIGAALISGLLLYHTLIAGRYAQDPVLAWIWIALTAAALLSLSYIYLVKLLLKLRSPWSLQSARKIGLNTWEVTIAPNGHNGLRFEAGQFVWLGIGQSALSLDENPFSISSAPTSGPTLQFVIKELGDFTRSIGDIAPGTRALVDGPHGNMVIAGRRAPGIALIAGGVGIAPILSILRQLRLDDDPRPTALVYCNRCEDQIVCREELGAMARDHGTRVVHALYEPPDDWDGYRGMCDDCLIRQVFDQPQMMQWLYVLCGPPVMMGVAERALIEIGVPAGQIISERFTYD